ncbi:MAG: DUF4256 domain-containing protein [Enterococcus lemanii]|jgi:hypothetical protein
MEKEDQVAILKKRFNQNMARHPATTWALVEEALLNNEKLFSSILKMEETQGEPDVVRFAHLPGELYYVDCSSESPKGRRSICYDQAALNKRKKNKPTSSAEQIASELGIELLTEVDYVFLQTIAHFDEKTSSWLHTPKEIRELGGAIFGDKRFGRTFIYHNAADSYYSVRGFRGKILIENK